MKGIVITDKNRDVLASRFMVEPDDKTALLPLGYYLVTEFGNDETFQTLTEDAFDASFTKGEMLKDDWFDMVESEL